MKFDKIQLLSLVLALISAITFGPFANAISAEEYCQVHNDSGVPGTCTVCSAGTWVVLRDNLGNDVCKKCGDGGCTQADCSETTDYPGCVQ